MYSNKKFSRNQQNTKRLRENLYLFTILSYLQCLSNNDCKYIYLIYAVLFCNSIVKESVQSMKKEIDSDESRIRP